MAQVTRADGHRIRTEREKADLTVAEMISALKGEGIDRHPDHLRSVELGHRQPSFKMFNAIARILKERTGVERDDLLADEPIEEPA